MGGKERKGRGGKVEASHCESQREDPSSVRGELIIGKDIEKPETDILQIPLPPTSLIQSKGVTSPKVEAVGVDNECEAEVYILTSDVVCSVWGRGVSLLFSTWEKYHE